MAGLLVAQQVDQHRGEAVHRVGGQPALGLEVLGGQRVERPERQRIAVQQHQCRLFGAPSRPLRLAVTALLYARALDTQVARRSPIDQTRAPPGSIGPAAATPAPAGPAAPGRTATRAVRRGPAAPTAARSRPRAALGQVGQRERGAGLERDPRLRHPPRHRRASRLAPDARADRQRDQRPVAQVGQPDRLPPRQWIGRAHRRLDRLVGDHLDGPARRAPRRSRPTRSRRRGLRSGALSIRSSELSVPRVISTAGCRAWKSASSRGMSTLCDVTVPIVTVPRTSWVTSSTATCSVADRRERRPGVAAAPPRPPRSAAPSRRERSSSGCPSSRSRRCDLRADRRLSDVDALGCPGEVAPPRRRRRNTPAVVVP